MTTDAEIDAWAEAHGHQLPMFPEVRERLRRVMDADRTNRCGTCGESTWRTFAGTRIDGENVAVVWSTCRHGHLTEDKMGASRIFAAFDPVAV
jgi:hypothetical protein